MKKIKSILFITVFVISIMCVSFSANAMTVTNTYADVSGTSTQANNLINYARSFDGFIGSDFVVFSDNSYSYYIVWGDLEYDNNVVKSDEKISYIHYYRYTNNSSYDYVYDYSTSSNLHLTVTNMVTSNIDNLGYYSPTYDDYVTNDSINNKFTALIIVLVGFTGVIMFKTLRGSNS